MEFFVVPGSPDVCTLWGGADMWGRVGGEAGALTPPASLLPASLSLSEDLSLTQASPAPFLHPVNIAGLLAHEYGFPSSLTRDGCWGQSC